MVFLRYYLILSVLFYSQLIIAQSPSYPQQEIFQYSYTIYSVESDEILQTLEGYVAKLPGVTQVKTKYKSDSRMAHFVFYRREDAATGENRKEEFSLSDIKSQIIALGMMTGDLNIEKVSHR